MATGYYELTALQERVGELVDRHGEAKHRALYHDIAAQKAKMLFSSVSQMTIHIAAREYSRIAKQLHQLKADVTQKLHPETVFAESILDATDMSAFFTKSYDKLSLIDPMAMTPDTALAHRDEYQTLVDHLNVYRDWLQHLEAGNTPQSVIMSPTLLLLRKRLYAYIYPKGQWSNRNVSTLWKKGYVVARPNSTCTDVALAFGNINVVISFKNTMRSNLSLTVAGDKH